jgi:hypothetical protein
MLVTYENINNHDISVDIHKIRRNMLTFVTSRIDSLREYLLQKTYRSVFLNKHISLLLTSSAQQRKLQPFFFLICSYILKKRGRVMISAPLQTSLRGSLFFRKMSPCWMPINSEVERNFKKADEVLVCYFPAASKTEYIVFVRVITKLMNDLISVRYVTVNKYWNK